MEQYRIEEKLKQHKKTHLTEEVYALVQKEKNKFERMGVKITIQKIVNNAVIYYLNEKD